MVRLVIWDATLPLRRHRNEIKEFRDEPYKKLRKNQTYRPQHSSHLLQISQICLSILPLPNKPNNFVRIGTGIWRVFHVLKKINNPVVHDFWLTLIRYTIKTGAYTLQWRQNGRDGVSNHQPHDCLLKRLFRRRSKKTPKLRVTGLRVGNSQVIGEFPAQRASDK